MTMRPQVTIVTPTRPAGMATLLERCIPSVARQQYSGFVQHVIVSDVNPALYAPLRAAVTDAQDMQDCVYTSTMIEINDTWRNPLTLRCTGSFPWQFGSYLALGDFVGFLGDDDEYLPWHVDRHVSTMEETGADFSISSIRFKVNGEPRFIIGDDTFEHGHLDSTGVMCRREALRVANWPIASLDEDPRIADAGDYRMVRDWLAGGLRGAFVQHGPTGVHHDGWLKDWEDGKPRHP